MSFGLPENVATFGEDVDALFYLILVITGIAFFAVQITLVWFVIRYRHREGQPARYTHGSNRIEVIWTIVPALILVVIALMSQKAWAHVRLDFPKDPYVVQLEPAQFQWDIRYPGLDGKFGNDDDYMTVNKLRVPFGRPIVVEMTSKDVLHSFFLPEFRVKQDVLPGMTTKVWFEPVRTGKWEIVCAELCGLGHYRMRGEIHVLPEAEFEKWREDKEAGPPLPKRTPK